MPGSRGGRRVGALLAWLALLALPGAGGAETRLQPTAEVGPDLRLVVRNTGDEAAHAVAPRLVYQHRTATGDGVTLDAGTLHEWRFPLPPPPGRGTFPATVRVDYADPSGRVGSVPLVVLVPAAGTGSSSIRASLEVGPLAGIANGKLVLDNASSHPVAGRVVFVLPGGMSTEPESLPAQVAPGGRTIVPVGIQGHGTVPPGAHRIYAVFEYAEGGEHVTIVAPAELAAIAGRGPRERPLLVGLGALGITFALLAVAWRRAARRV